MITEEEYMAAVPDCCRLRTYEEHNDIMLCWGLVAQIRDKTPKTSCGLCEFNAEPAGDFARIEWLEGIAKERMWEKLKGEHEHV